MSAGLRSGPSIPWFGLDWSPKHAFLKDSCNLGVLFGNCHLNFMFLDMSNINMVLIVSCTLFRDFAKFTKLNVFGKRALCR